MLTVILLFLGVGVFAGLAAGLFGVGGGAIIVPFSLFIFTQCLSPALDVDLAMMLAIGTSIATIPLTGASAVYRHYQLKSLDSALVLLIVPGMVLGGLFGSFMAPLIGGIVLKKAFGAFQLFMAWKIFRSTQLQQDQPQEQPIAPDLQKPQGYTAGFGIGFISSLFGIGGGTLTVPFLLSKGYRMTLAIGVSSAAGVCMAAFATLGFAFFEKLQTGSTLLDEQDYVVGYIFWPGVLSILTTSIVFSRLGVNLAHRLSVLKLKQFFSLFLGIVGLKLLL